MYEGYSTGGGGGRVGELSELSSGMTAAEEGEMSMSHVAGKEKQGKDRRERGKRKRKRTRKRKLA